MTNPIPRKKFTVKDYYTMAEVGILTSDMKVELINGDIVTMSPSKSIHSGMINHLSRLFYNNQIEECIIVQNPIRINNHSEPEPDIVIAKYKEDSYQSKHPEPDDIYLILEVSDSTLEKDRTTKVDLYAKAGIPCYWIINLIDKQIEVFSNPLLGKYAKKIIVNTGDKLILESPSLSFSYTDIFI